MQTRLKCWEKENVQSSAFPLFRVSPLMWRLHLFCCFIVSSMMALMIAATPHFPMSICLATIDLNWCGNGERESAAKRFPSIFYYTKIDSKVKYLPANFFFPIFATRFQFYFNNKKTPPFISLLIVVIWPKYVTVGSECNLCPKSVQAYTSSFTLIRVNYCQLHHFVRYIQTGVSNTAAWWGYP